MESDFSTQGSDTEQENHELKITSPPNSGKAKSNKMIGEGKKYCKTENCDSFSLSGINAEKRDVQLSSSTKNKPKQPKKHSNSERFGDFKIIGQPKPKRKFTGKQHKHKFVESYKAKKKTEICKNWENTGECKFGDS